MTNKIKKIGRDRYINLNNEITFMIRHIIDAEFEKVSNKTHNNTLTNKDDYVITVFIYSHHYENTLYKKQIPFSQFLLLIKAEPCGKNCIQIDNMDFFINLKLLLAMDYRERQKIKQLLVGAKSYWLKTSSSGYGVDMCHSIELNKPKYKG